MSEWQFWTVVLVLALVGGARAVSWVRESRVRSPEDRLRQAYAEGAIDEQELERRLAYHLDDRNAEIVRWLDDNVSGVAEAKGKRIAKRFDSLDELRRADHEEIVDVHGIGDSTAAAIRREFEDY